MKLGWKVLIPVSLGWILLVATVRAVGREVNFQRNYLLVAAGIVALIAVITMFLPQKKEPEAEPEPQEFDPFAGGFPVPPPLESVSRSERDSSRG
jgi:NADH-quinone oxidoreductase subunit H